MFKRWLAILGAVVLIVGTSQVLWGGGGEEYPWGNVKGGGSGNTGSSGTATTITSSGSPLRRIFIVRPAPMGGFYFVPLSLPVDISAKTTAGGKKVEN
jgi:hypothetical protein